MEVLCYKGAKRIKIRRNVHKTKSWLCYDRTGTIIHFGNPYVLEDVPHIPRVIVGGPFKKSVDTVFDVILGKAKPEGKLTYDVKFN